jgi:hypothetical protein
MIRQPGCVALVSIIKLYCSPLIQLPLPLNRSLRSHAFPRVSKCLFLVISAVANIGNESRNPGKCQRIILSSTTVAWKSIGHMLLHTIVSRFTDVEDSKRIVFNCIYTSLVLSHPKFIFSHINLQFQYLPFRFQLPDAVSTSFLRFHCFLCLLLLIESKREA